MAILCLDGASSLAIVEWAYEELLGGRDTPNLRILAGLRPPLDTVEVDCYFRATLRDLDWELEDGHQFLRAYAVEIARGIVDVTLSPLSASQDMYTLCSKLDYPEDLSAWLYIADGLDPDNYSMLDEKTTNELIGREAQRLLDENKG